MTNVVGIFSRGTLPANERAPEEVIQEKLSVRRQAVLMPQKFELVQLFVEVMQETNNEEVIYHAQQTYNFALESFEKDVVQYAINFLQALKDGFMPDNLICA